MLRACKRDGYNASIVSCGSELVSPEQPAASGEAWQLPSASAQLPGELLASWQLSQH